MKIIQVSKETNIIQRMLSLRASRKQRFHHREFIIEGTTAIDEAFKQKWYIKALFYNADCQLSGWAKHYIHNFKVNAVYALTKQLMMKISDKKDCPELIALGATRILELSSYKPQDKEVIVVVDQPKSAGNLGMIIRSAKAFGVNALVISGHAADEYDPKCIRSSAGAFFSLDIYRETGISRFVKKIAELRLAYSVAIIATGNKGDVDIEDLACNNDLLFLILGNETKGISKGYQEVADQFVKIALPGQFNSLNVGAAASIFLYEIFRKRSKFK